VILPSILVDIKIDVSSHILILNTSILVANNMNQREYLSLPLPFVVI
jgi:hypothetical protein